MIPDAQIAKLIVKYGVYEKPGPRKGQRIFSVKCSACGEKILSDAPEGTGVSLTKRGTAVFWHGGCLARVWGSRIK